MSLLRQFAESDAALDIITTIAWVVGIISSVVFIALFGRLPLFRKTPIGWIHRLMMVYLPNGLIKLDDQLTGGRLTHNARRLYDYLLHDRHPVVMVIFIMLQAGSELLFIPPAWHFLTRVQKYLLLPLLVTLPYLTLYWSYSTFAHHISEDGYPSALSRYPYDYSMYHPRQSCRTCRRPKPARSKHCPICKTCIERQDHHCIWINNCVGFHNYHHFIALLVSTACLLGWGAWNGLRILDTIMQEIFVPERLTRGSYTAKRWSTGLGWGERLNVYSMGLATNTRIGAVTMLACMTFPLALAFLIYHAYLMWAGTTTNETAKLADLREDILDGLVWRARITEVRSEYPGPLDESIVYDAMHHIDSRSMTGKAPKWAGGKTAEWWIIRTKGGAPPTRWKAMHSDGRGHEEVIDERWVRVRTMTEIDNIYDLGFLQNVKDALLRQSEAG